MRKILDVSPYQVIASERKGKVRNTCLRENSSYDYQETLKKSNIKAWHFNRNRSSGKYNCIDSFSAGRVNRQKTLSPSMFSPKGDLPSSPFTNSFQDTQNTNYIFPNQNDFRNVSPNRVGREDFSSFPMEMEEEIGKNFEMPHAVSLGIASGLFVLGLLSWVL